MKNMKGIAISDSAKRTKLAKIAVDHNGLKAIVRERGVVTLLDELVQNALDTAATDITVEITSPSTNRVRVVVTDNDPGGYVDLSHAYTLFSQSVKRDDPLKRGFMNVGDKLAVSFSVEGRITSTTGSVIIEGDERRSGRMTTAVGSVVDLTFPLTKVDMAEMLARHYLVPEGVQLTVNGDAVSTSKPKLVTEGKLPVYVAEIVDGMSVMRERERITKLELHEPSVQGAWIYVLGIPVQAVELPYSVNVLGRLKADMKRDTIPPTALKRIKVAIADAVIDELDADDLSTWVRAVAVDASDDVVRKLVEAQFGSDAMIANPKDHEANAEAVAAGRKLIHGGTYSKSEWDRIRGIQTVDPSFAPSSSKEYGRSNRSSLVPPAIISEQLWTADARRVVAWTKEAARKALGISLGVQILDNANATNLADYCGNQVRFNIGTLGGWDWFDKSNSADHIALVIHELGHHGHEDWGHTEKWANHGFDIAAKIVLWGVTP